MVAFGTFNKLLLVAFSGHGMMLPCGLLPCI